MSHPSRAATLFYTPYGLAKSLVLEMRQKKCIPINTKGNVSFKRERNRDLVFVFGCVPPVRPLAIAEAVYRVPVFGRFKMTKSLIDQYAIQLREWKRAAGFEVIRLVVFCTGSRFARQDLYRFLTRELGSRGIGISEDENLPAAWVVTVDEFFYFCVPPLEQDIWIDSRPQGEAERDGSLPGQIAAAMVFHAQIKRGECIWDPTCGSGTILSEAHRLGLDLELVGSDSDPNAVQIAKTKIPGAKLFSESIFDMKTPLGVCHIIANLPFGKKHQAQGGLQNLYIEICRRFSTTPSCRKGRLVLLSSSQSLLTSSIEMMGNLEIVKLFPLQTKGLKCSIVVSRIHA